MKQRTLTGLAMAAGLLLTGTAHAEIINGSFEDNFNDWTVTGDGYLVTMDGNTRQRHDYQTYQGWEGADVWFAGTAAAGDSYAVFGSHGNESVGSLTSSLWTATHQFLSFSHAGNNTSGVSDNGKAFAAILDANGNELGRVLATSYNDSQWRTWSLDLSNLGLNQGDQFRFHYQDNASWSVIDNVSQQGAALAVADVSAPLSLSVLALGGLLVTRRRQPLAD